MYKFLNSVKSLFGLGKGERENYSKLSLEELKKKAAAKKRELVKAADIAKVQPNEFRKRYGLVGMENIGNTCYINASIQCLSHCSELTQWLLAGKWEEDVNTVNVIGTEGQLLVEYVRLLHELWRPQQISRLNEQIEPVNPTAFKERLEKENAVVGPG